MIEEAERLGGFAMAHGMARCPTVGMCRPAQTIPAHVQVHEGISHRIDRRSPGIKVSNRGVQGARRGPRRVGQGFVTRPESEIEPTGAMAGRKTKSHVSTGIAPGWRGSHAMNISDGNCFMQENKYIKINMYYDWFVAKNPVFRLIVWDVIF